MRYTYDGYLTANTGPGGSLQRAFTTTSFEEAEKEYFNVDVIKVTDNMSKQEVFKISNEDDLAEWRTTLERKAAWNPVKDLLADHLKGDPGDVPPEVLFDCIESHWTKQPTPYHDFPVERNPDYRPA